MFIPGIVLSRQFYDEEIAPLLASNFPSLGYSAALLGPGSDVLGYDDQMSTDHDWGPRLQIFTSEEDKSLQPELEKLLPGKVQLGVMVATLPDFVERILGIDPGSSIEVEHWLAFPSQALLSLTAGAIHHDGLGDLTSLRKKLAWYPEDIWRYLLACSWQRIGQEEHLMPRAGLVGDELGSAIIGSRLVRDIMQLCFLIEKRYAPYPKWFGTAFSRLSRANQLQPILSKIQYADNWQGRGAALSQAIPLLAQMQNQLGLCELLAEQVNPFHDRPFQVIHGEQCAQKLLQSITDPSVKSLTGRPLIGNIDHFSDSTDLKGGEFKLILRQLWRS